MKFIPIIAVVILGVGIWQAFPKQDHTTQDNSAVYQTGAQIQSDKQTLAQIEQELQMALKSGGIHPDTYLEIKQQLNKLQADGVDPERVAAALAIMAKLDVGGQRYQKQSDESAHAEPAPQTATASKRQVAALPGPQTPSPQSNTVSSPALPASTPVSSAPVQSQPKPSCQSNTSPVFTNHITDTSKINYVVPPPTMGSGPSLKPHSYIGTDNARVPVYAPTDMTLITGAYYIYGPYGLDFRVSCEVKLRFGHITEPIDEIKSVFPDTPAQDTRDQKIDHEISFKAGDLIGYTTRGNWDFGVYNSSTSNRYADDPNWNNSTIYTTAVCPFDYFTASLKSAYTTKFNSQILCGNPPHGESFCK